MMDKINSDDKVEAVAKRQISKPKKAMTARRFKTLLSLTKNLKESERGKPLQNEANGVEGNHTNEERKNSNTSLCPRKKNGVKFLLRRVRRSGHQQTENSSGSVTHSKLHETKKLQRKDNNFMRSKLYDETLHPDHKSATNFVEYWVPVRLSNVQLEQYCGSLLSQSKLLCSSAKPESWDFLREILITARKCCDHPYLVDRSLHSSLIQVIPEHERLDAEIKLSSKLLLLQRILLELKSRKLRAVVLYQSLGGAGSISTRDILDDIMHEKFNDSFVCIYSGMSRPKRLAAINTFNELSNGVFVCLMETRACRLRTKLSSVDTVILFNSDWDPMNNLNALKRINLHSQFDLVKLFRLYSCHTIEEKVLMFAKQGMALEGNTINIRKSACHGLLRWGALYLFRQLDEFHKGNARHSHSITSGTDSFLEDVFLELSELLPNKVESNCSVNSSFISEVNPISDTYRKDVSLRGEVEFSRMTNLSVVEEALIKDPPHVFWMNLLKGRSPNWVYIRTHYPRNRKRLQIDDVPQESAWDEATSNGSENNSNFCHVSQLLKRKKRPKLQCQEKTRKLSDFKKHKQCNNEVQRTPLDSGNRVAPLLDQQTEATISDISFDVPSAHSKLPSEERDQALESTARQDDQYTDVPLYLAQELISSSPALITENLLPQVPFNTTEDGREETLRSGAQINSTNSDNHQNAESSEVLPQACQLACTILQPELHRLEEEIKQISEQHEEKRLQARIACEKEVDQIRKRYKAELHNDEVAFVANKAMLEMEYNKVYRSAILAEMLMLRDNDKLLDANAKEAEAVKSAREENNNGRPKTSEQATETVPNILTLHTSNQVQPSPCTVPAPTQPSTEPITPSQQRPTKSHVGASRPVSSTNLVRALHSECNHLRPPLIPTRSPTVKQMVVKNPTKTSPVVMAPQILTSPVILAPNLPFDFSRNLQPGYVLRAPAPHLRNARSPESKRGVVMPSSFQSFR